MLIHDRIQDYFEADSNKNGLWKQHLMFSACFNLKEIILSHFKINIPVCAAFIGISKDFNKVKYLNLFSKLLKLFYLFILMFFNLLK